MTAIIMPNIIQMMHPTDVEQPSLNVSRNPSPLLRAKSPTMKTTPIIIKTVHILIIIPTDERFHSFFQDSKYNLKNFR